MKVVMENLGLLDVLDPRMDTVFRSVLNGDKSAIQSMEEQGIISIKMTDSNTMKISTNPDELKKLEDEEKPST